MCSLSCHCVCCSVILSNSWGRLNIDMSSYQYRDPHVKDKTVSPVLSLIWESPYLGKTVFILRRGPGLLDSQDLLWYNPIWHTVLQWQVIHIKFWTFTKILHFSPQWQVLRSIAGLHIKACLGHVDLVSGHTNFCGYVPDWASDFSVRACNYFPSSIHKLYKACTNIGLARKKFCRAHKFSEPRACKPNA